MDYLSRIALFTEVAKLESFSGAARHLGITSSAVSKQIQNLEHELQTKLFHRTTRKVSLTEEGAILYQRTKSALENIQEAREELNERTTTPKGHIRVSLPVSLGIHYLKKPIAQFAQAYPAISLDIEFSDRHVNIAEEEYDLALRIGALTDSTLIAKKLASIPVHPFTSPAYLQQHGPIDTPAALQGLNVFEYTRHGGQHIWHYADLDGTRKSIDLQTHFSCDSVEMMKEAALAGIGIFIAPEIFVRQELASGQLVKLLPAYQTLPVRNLYAIFPPNRYVRKRIRLFIEAIQAYCQKHL